MLRSTLRNRTNVRKASNAENLIPGAKPANYKAVSRITNSNPLREASIRRRNRVTSGSNSYLLVQKRRKVLTRPVTPVPEVYSSLPTPPATHAGSPAPEAQKAAPGKAPSLPRFLARPNVFIDEENYKAVDPEALQNVPLMYAKDSLRRLGHSMHRVNEGLRMHPFNIRSLPRELMVMVTDVSGPMPTHLLAVPGSNGQVSLHPTHSIVIATELANVPSLPRSARQVALQPGESLSLPVVPFPTADPATFNIMHSFLYRKDLSELIAQLLPGLPGEVQYPAHSGNAIRDWALRISYAYSTYAIVNFLRKVKGVYNNGYTFGVVDQEFWNIISLAWEVLINAFAMSRGFAPDFGHRQQL